VQGWRMVVVDSLDLDLGVPHAASPILFAARLGRFRWGIEPALTSPFPLLASLLVGFGAEACRLPAAGVGATRSALIKVMVLGPSRAKTKIYLMHAHLDLAGC
jgi:hypothetical protein